MPEKPTFRFFPPDRLAKYPHMFHRDVIVWERFLDRHAKKIDKVAYDVHVGEGVDPGVNVPDTWRQDAIHLSKKRIDAVAWVGPEIWVIECKSIAPIFAPGQAWAYQYLFNLAMPVGTKSVPMVVHEYCTPDVEMVAAALGVRMLHFPSS